MKVEAPSKNSIKRIAQVGLSAKGLVYVLLGLIAVMSAFHIGGQNSQDTDKGGVISTISEQAGGKILLGILTTGLLCYSLWRLIQVFRKNEGEKSGMKEIALRARYLFSGLVYSFFAFQTARLLYTSKQSSGNQQQSLVQQVLEMPAGQWLVGLIAIIIAGVGIYQIYYGFSEKYRKHAQKVDQSGKAGMLLKSGKLGYIARGVVWLLISWSFVKAAISYNSSEAGSTSKAFDFLQEAPYGPYLFAAVALGLVCYGVFNFVRAAYERFE